MPIEVRQTDEFAAWLATLRDRRAAARINSRIDRAAQGNFGDAKFFGGFGEMRVDYGPATASTFSIAERFLSFSCAEATRVRRVPMSSAPKESRRT